MSTLVLNQVTYVNILWGVV